MTALLLAALLVLGLPSATRAQTADELFEPTILHEIRLSIHPRDLQQLRDTFDQNTFYPAALEWRGVVAHDVAVRSRGRASRNPSKPGLLLEFDRYTEGQRFLGLRALVLDNLWQDPSMVRQAAALTLFARMGLPASRQSFARLYVNGMYFGVYGVVESVDADFLARHLGDESAYLFEYRNVQLYYGGYLGEDLELYKPLFEARTRRLEPDEVLYGPVRDLWRDVNQSPDALWREQVESRIDLAQLVRTVAVDAFISEGDGFLGSTGMSNFYLYRDAGTLRHGVIVWDKDLTFLHVTSPILLRTDENEIIRRALLFRDLRALFLDTVEQCARVSIEAGWLRSEIVRMSSLIAAAALEDPLKPISNEEFESAVQFMASFAVERPPVVLQQVIALRRAR